MLSHGIVVEMVRLAQNPPLSFELPVVESPFLLKVKVLAFQLCVTLCGPGEL